ncbi:MAG: competence/damage-inducible protein A [Verrucomicrobiae bacterium]|nr:competence/damage-inducible protein A [Verrucomicrobiae bacterium]
MTARVEIINTGSELLLGRVLNTHQLWLCRQLIDAGFLVHRQVTVADTGPEIAQAVREALARAEIVITTGGLGPTSDDLTRDHVAQLLGRRLQEDAAVLAHIAAWFARRQRRQPPTTRVQALVPEGATVLMNQFGTAPGLWLEVPAGRFRAEGGSVLIMLPGPPRELQPMFCDQVLPRLRQHFPGREEYAVVTLRSTGLGESRVEEMITPPLQALLQQGLELGFCARPAEVDVRLSARGPQAAERVSQGRQIVEKLVGLWIFGEGDEKLEEVVARLLLQQKVRLALAESCTGGFVAHRLTNIPGISQALWGGVVAYANEAKSAWLDVPPELLAAHGAVSAPVAQAMAQGALRRAQADVAVALTGIAGPGGGTPEKPVGTVFLALAWRDGIHVQAHLNAMDRETFKYVTSQQALDLLRRRLLGLPLEQGRP